MHWTLSLALWIDALGYKPHKSQEHLACRNASPAISKSILWEFGEPPHKLDKPAKTDKTVVCQFLSFFANANAKTGQHPYSLNKIIESNRLKKKLKLS